MSGNEWCSPAGTRRYCTYGYEDIESEQCPNYYELAHRGVGWMTDEFGRHFCPAHAKHQPRCKTEECGRLISAMQELCTTHRVMAMQLEDGPDEAEGCAE